MNQQQRFLVEWYQPELMMSPCKRSAAALRASADRMSAEGASVRLESMLAVPTDEVVFGVFTAESERVVAKTCERAGMPAQRLTVVADIHLPPADH